MKSAIRALSLLAAIFASALSWAGVGLIAELRPGFDPGLLAPQFGIQYVESTPNAPFSYFYLVDESQQVAVLAAMASHPGVVWAEHDKDFIIPESTNGKGGSLPQLRKQRLLVQYTPGTGYSENLQWMNRIEWSNPTGTEHRSVRVAILDTGLSPHQPVLWQRVVADMSAIHRETRGFDLKSHLRGNRNFDPNGALGHGTMVTSLISQLAPDAELIICRVADAAGFSNSWRIIKGIAFAVTHGAELANVSLGAYSGIPALSEVLEWTETKGLQLVGAIGNDNIEDCMYPARIQKVIAVTAVDPEDRKASFSNWEGRADMSAPGTGIRGANWDGTMLIWHGTSFSAPIVTGCVAQALKLREPMIPEVLRDTLDGVGVNINPLNPQYIDRLGPRVNLRLIKIALGVGP